MKNTKAFTLIELLVVVLIIGILAAVALPQYQLAVVKSRTSALLPLMTSIANAQEAYYMATGTYTVHFTDLDIDVPSGCIFQEHGNGIEEYYACGNDFLLNLAARPGVGLSYCPNDSSNPVNCVAHRFFRLSYIYNHADTDAGKRTCAFFRSSKIGQQICRTLPNFEEVDN